MEIFLITSNVLLWLVIVMLSMGLFLAIRQIGVLHERIAPAGALMNDQGPSIGVLAPEFTLIDLMGKKVQIGGVNSESKNSLLFFLSPDCPVCKKMLPVIQSLSGEEKKNTEILLMSDGDPDEHKIFIDKYALHNFKYAISKEVGIRFGVGKLPYAILIDETGTIRSKGLVNTREHIESLFYAKESGYSSIQDYLRTQTGT